uniref:TRAFFICKING PROTEIN B n=2 Tax=Neisseria gonorrhoeae TaxID=485 RepID=UPI0000DD5CAB|nr:Chain A, TRAFFICKING PROTEIN B [Neisseria gonorrhoeae]2BSQ_B Chain B, TRAFFICKING PROTEIN B [Neisseria gonorrhoeae]2BSQ_C Chain C, TRAFFICKING PROTEIN B [Neisseria gonorrhoeae]2BSQ_D Chain D, TRAFFICKING PROTEIN B [Neisseria gonorrhoeae]
MILLDTNVISEPLRPQPNERVVAWLDSLILEDVYLSAITVAEMRLGVALLLNGKKKNVLHERMEQSILPLFAGRILPFDEPVAAIYAQIRSYAKTHGKEIAAADGYIAATAKQHSMTVATRDTGSFFAADVAVFNPWHLEHHHHHH